MTLTSDQRWLLRTVGGWAMLDALISQAGIAHLMTSQQGGTGRATDDGPDWLAGGFQCGGGKIVSPAFGTPLVTVTAAQISEHARTISTALMTQMVDCQQASRRETMRVYGWCRCKSEQCASSTDPIWGGRHHPSEDEWNAHLNTVELLRDFTDKLLDRVLIGETADDGQLGLFDVEAS